MPSLLKVISLMMMLSLMMMGCNNGDQKNSQGEVEENNIVTIVYEEIDERAEREEIEKISKPILEAIKEYNTEELSNYVHPEKGVRFSPYTDLTPTDLTFSKEEVANLMKDQEKHLWGYYDGSGFDIEFTPREYFNQFVYPIDYINESHEIGYKEPVSTPRYEGNYQEYFEKAVYIEYFYRGTKDAEYFDWKSLRLVYERYEGQWYLVAIIHSEKTV